MPLVAEDEMAAVWTIDAWVSAVGIDSDVYRELLDKALNPSSPECEPLELPDPGSDDAQVVMALLKKQQVPTRRAVNARAANPRPHAPLPVWSDDQIDRFGRVAAAWVYEVRSSDASGPTWAELFGSPPVRQIREELDLTRRGRDLNAVMTRARGRGWLAWDRDRERSLCAGPSFFASRYQSPAAVGRRVVAAVRRFHLANDGRRPRWEDLVADIHDGAGNAVFHDIDDARAQSVWLEAEHWIAIKAELITAGSKAKRWQKRNKAGRRQLGDSSRAPGKGSPDVSKAPA